MRQLVHEFGFVIVTKMVEHAGGSVDAESLRADLEAWREREQIRLYSNV